MRHGKNRENIYIIQINILNYIQNSKVFFYLTTMAVQAIRSAMRWGVWFGLFQHNEGVWSNVGNVVAPLRGGDI